MALETILDDILDGWSKVRVVRLFALRTDDFLASGREVARLTVLRLSVHYRYVEMFRRIFQLLQVSPVELRL